MGARFAAEVASRFVAAVPALPVADERKAVAFFEDALGFTDLRHEGQGLGILRRDAVEVHVWVADGSAPGAPLRDQWWGTREFGVLDPDGGRARAGRVPLPGTSGCATL